MSQQRFYIESPVELPLSFSGQFGPVGPGWARHREPERRPAAPSPILAGGTGTT